MSGTFFVVGTPIGNRADLSARAEETLKNARRIIAEDTRTLRKLIAVPKEVRVTTLNAFASPAVFRSVLEGLRAGEDIALITDAGTPAISDPGGALIAYLVTHEPEIRIVPVPGPSAVTALLSIAGFPADKFLFLGFVPKKGQAAFWRRVQEAKDTVVFFESVHRIQKTLEAMNKEVGNVTIVVGRELTKMFESVYRGTVESVREKIRRDPHKGEYVIAVRR